MQDGTFIPMVLGNIQCKKHNKPTRELELFQLIKIPDSTISFYGDWIEKIPLL